MARLETLPPDQRAVLDLVLKRGRSYDEIAQVLRIDRAGVRDRALAAFDALGPPTRIPPERRALVTDYLLGQLPPRVADGTRERLGQSASERAWARVLASELAPIASRPLPEIPAEQAVPHDAADPTVAQTTAHDAPDPTVAQTTAHDAADPTGAPAPVGAAAGGGPGPGGASTPRSTRVRPSSRVGGAIVLGAGALVVAAIVAVVLLTRGSSGSPASTHTSASAGTTPTRTSTATGTTSTSAKNAARLVARIAMRPTSPGSKAAATVFVIKQGKNTGLLIRGQHIPANTKHDAYAVWLYNSPADNDRLGFVTPAVTSSGTLQAGTVLPSNAKHFKQILLTLETTAKPHTPGKRILTASLTGL